MSIALRVVLAILCLIFLFATVRMVAKGRLQIKYSLLWMLMSLVLIVCAIFPGIVSFFSALFGFEAPSNLAFLLGFFFLLVVCLSLSIIVSWQSGYIRSLVQSLALLEKRVDVLSGRETVSCGDRQVERATVEREEDQSRG